MEGIDVYELDNTNSDDSTCNGRLRLLFLLRRGATCRLVWWLFGAAIIAVCGNGELSRQCAIMDL